MKMFALLSALDSHMFVYIIDVSKLEIKYLKINYIAWLLLFFGNN